MCDFTKINHIIVKEFPHIGIIINFYITSQHRWGYITKDNKLRLIIDDRYLNHDNIFNFFEDIINYIIKNKLAKYEYIKYICNYEIEIYFNNLSLEILLQII